MLTPKHKAKLKAAKAETDRVSQYLSGIINENYDQATAARKFGICPQDFSRNVGCNFVYYYRQRKLLSQATADEIQMLLETPYDKLFRDILNITNQPVWLIDYETSHLIYDIMQQALDEREIRILTARYGLPIEDEDIKPQTLKEVAATENLSRERVRKIHLRALRKLRDPKYLNVLLPNHDSYIAAVQESDELKKMSQELDDEIVHLINQNDRLRTELPTKRSLVKMLTEENTSDEDTMTALIHTLFDIEPVCPDLPDDTDIQELHFSTRIVNALRRNHIYTLGELKTKSLSDLSKCSTLGKKSIQELTYKLYTECGVLLKS